MMAMDAFFVASKRCIPSTFNDSSINKAKRLIMRYSSLPKQLASAQTAIYNAMEHDEIQKKLNQYGFTSKRMQEGNGLLNHAILLHHEKNDRYGEKQELSSQLDAQAKATKKRFKDHVDTVKLAFRHEPATLAKFKVNRIATKKDEWQLQANYFYSKAVMYADVLESYQLSQSELTQNQASVEALMAIRNRRMQKKGEAEEATRNRDLSMQALHVWMKEFRSIARIALKDSPQLLEALGIQVKTQKYPKAKQAS